MGKAKAVVLGVEQYKELMEELEIIQEQEDPKVQEALQEARRDFELGKTITLDELDKELGITKDELGSCKSFK
jgi:PHD/YefM family antitoxin component YafN of YafNO toxin-antitoxin module